jgi:hypothetical protein
VFTKSEPVGGSDGVPIYQVPPINCGNKTQLSYIIKDLNSRNLLYTSEAFKYDIVTVYEQSFRTTEDTNKGLPYLVVSELGRQFLIFIREDKPNPLLSV